MIISALKLVSYLFDLKTGTSNWTPYLVNYSYSKTYFTTSSHVLFPPPLILLLPNFPFSVALWLPTSVFLKTAESLCGLVILGTGAILTGALAFVCSLGGCCFRGCRFTRSRSKPSALRLMSMWRWKLMA